jgi:hypothetical protein
MNTYRQQQLRAAALIEQGATAEQIAAVYGWTARGEPEQSAQTGYNQTLTPSRKRGIIKAIKRHVRRWKQKQEGKTMKKYAVYTHYDSNKSVIGYIIPQFDNGIAFITQRTYNKLLKKRTIGGNAGIYSDYPGEIRITNDDKTEFIGYMQ